MISYAKFNVLGNSFEFLSPPGNSILTKSLASRTSLLGNSTLTALYKSFNPDPLTLMDPMILLLSKLLTLAPLRLITTPH